jgi:hypothetical protein
VPTKKTPAKKRTVAVRDIKTKANPKGGITLPIAGVSPAGLKFTGPTMAAKGGTEVAVEELVIATERFEID